MSNESFRRSANRIRSNWRLTIGQHPRIADFQPIQNPLNQRKYDEAVANWVRELEGNLRRTIEQATGNTRDEPTSD